MYNFSYKKITQSWALLALFFLAGLQAKSLRPGESFVVYDISSLVKEESYNVYWNTLYNKLCQRYDELISSHQPITPTTLITEHIARFCNTYEQKISTYLRNEPFFKQQHLFEPAIHRGTLARIFTTLNEITTWYCVAGAQHIQPSLKTDALITMLSSLISTQHVNYLLTQLHTSKELTKNNLKKLFSKQPTFYVVEKYNIDETISLGLFVMPHAVGTRLYWALSAGSTSCYEKLMQLKNYVCQKKNSVYASCPELKIKKKYIIIALLLAGLVMGTPAALEHKDAVLALLYKFYEKIPSKSNVSEVYENLKDWLHELWYWTKAKINHMQYDETTSCPASNLDTTPLPIRPASNTPVNQELLENICLPTDSATQDPTFCSDLLRGESDYSCPIDQHTLNLHPNPWLPIYQNFSPEMQKVLTDVIHQLGLINKEFVHQAYELAKDGESLRQYVCQLNTLLDSNGLSALGDRLAVTWTTEVARHLPPA